MLQLYQVIYVLASVSLLAPICLLNHADQVNIAEWIGLSDYQVVANPVLYTSLFAIPFLLTWLLLKFANELQHQELSCDRIKSVKSAALDQFPIAIGYVFIALSINNWYTLAITLLVLSMVCYYTPAYFNLCLYLFGFRYYYVTTTDNIQILVPSRRSIGIGDKLSFKNLRRINNLTFIDIENEQSLS